MARPTPIYRIDDLFQLSTRSPGYYSLTSSLDPHEVSSTTKPSTLQKPGKMRRDNPTHGDGQRANDNVKPPSRPSDNWPPVENTRGHDHVKRVLSQANWKYLSDEAARHHARCHPESTDPIICTINTSKWQLGLFNAVYFELSFSDGSFWLVRTIFYDENNEDGRDKMLSELAVMKLVRQHTSIPVPAVFAYECDKNNPFGRPYLLQEAMKGKMLDKQFALSTPPEFQPKVASQMAQYIWELSRVTFDQIGRVWCGDRLDDEPRIIPFPTGFSDRLIGPFNSSRSYTGTYDTHMQELYSSKHQNDPRKGSSPWQAYSNVLTNVIPDIIHPGYLHGPFPLYHHNFGYHNMLVDEEFNITAIYDWANVRTAAVEEFSIYRDIMTYPLVNPKEKNRPIVRFRDLFVTAYRRLEQGGGDKDGLPLADVFASYLPEIQDHWHRGRGLPSAPQLQRSAKMLVHLLYGGGTTLENYGSKQEKGNRGRLLDQHGSEVVMMSSFAEDGVVIEVDLDKDSEFQVARA